MSLTGLSFDFQQNHPQRDNIHNRVSKPTIQKKITKRRFGDQEQEDEISSPPRSKFSMKPKHPRAHNNYIKHKKQKHPLVLGQKLSLNRIIETLDKDSLQNLFINLISKHPELSCSITDLSPKITVESSLSVLNDKLQRILDYMPYKVDPSSDYSFLRVKPLIADFFNSLSDYTLNFLPPVEQDLTISLNFLTEFLLKIFNKLPNFHAIEFKYYRKLTVEKFNNIFTDIIHQFINEKKQNIILLINNNWLDNFKQINEINNNEFASVYVFLKNEIDQFNKTGSTVLEDNNRTGANHYDDSEPSTSQNQLLGLNGLLNFSNDNSPLHGSTLGNVYDAI